MFARIDHVGVAVPDLNAGIALYEQLHGMTLIHREVLTPQGAELALLELDETQVELMAPLAADTPVGRFLARRGAGMHHLAYRVEDIDATLAQLRADGVELVDQVARPSLRGSRIAFLHPRATGGVLTEIVEH
jgi:methylmalonyl-CoA/ethylmalonyl-CoA epimerase